MYLYNVIAGRLMMVTGYFFSDDGIEIPGILFQYQDRK
jgi:hypothetical protein